MTFREAADFVMPLGQFKGLTLDKIGETDRGLLYLDWLRGMRYIRATVRAALETYLDDPAIAQAVAKLAKERA